MLSKWRDLTFAAQQRTVVFLYKFFIHIYILGIGAAAMWNKKAREWKRGRTDLFEDLSLKIGKSDRIIWFHCASAGELEQGKPLIEQLKKDYPSHRILVSFFSPSGFEAAKKYKPADIICYLPADTKKNAERFVQMVRPELVVFVKYEYWYFHLSAIASRHIPLLMVSAIFRKGQVFFKGYGSFYRKILFLFRHIFVQDEASVELLKSNGIEFCSIGGDTRFDRVSEVAAQDVSLPVIENFVEGHQVIVAGSTWPDDEKLLRHAFSFSDYKMIIAPHEINEAHINSIQKLFPEALSYSKLAPLFAVHRLAGSENPLWENIENDHQVEVKKQLKAAKILIIDNTGMLSRLYRYATITYIGGGFNKSGIHNTLEAAVYGKPVLFGPHFQKFREARDLVSRGAAYSVSNEQELKEKLEAWTRNEEALEKAGNTAKNYVEENRGATKRIASFIQENRLLTS
jgi:3-deoxy-D-manno-octulosonic-acid transferase